MKKAWGWTVWQCCWALGQIPSLGELMTATLYPYQPPPPTTLSRQTHQPSNLLAIFLFSPKGSEYSSILYNLRESTASWHGFWICFLTIQQRFLTFFGTGYKASHEMDCDMQIIHGESVKVFQGNSGEATFFFIDHFQFWILAIEVRHIRFSKISLRNY